jgi:preprotein translocase subunit YajC
VSFLIVMVLLLVVMYVLMIRPQRQRQQQQQSMIDGCGVGDDILTTGGIYGTVVEAEGDDIVVEIGEGMTVHMTRRGIAAVLPPESEDEDEEGAEEDAVEAEDTDGEDEVQLAAADVDEGSVTAHEEPVTEEAPVEEAASDRH